MARLLISPRALSRLRLVYPSSGDVQQVTTPANPLTGADAVWSNVAGLTALPCRVSPRRGRRIVTAGNPNLYQTHTISFRGYHPGIVPEMRIVAGGSNYLVLFVGHDGNLYETQCEVALTTSLSVAAFSFIDTVALSTAQAGAAGFLAGVVASAYPLYLSPAQEFAVGDTSRTVRFDSGPMIGVLGAAYAPAYPGATTAFDYGTTLRITMSNGTLSSSTEATVRQLGANLLALGELLVHFVTATLVSPGVYDISGLLPGRRGSDYVTAVASTTKCLLLVDHNGAAASAVQTMRIPVDRVGSSQLYYAHTADPNTAPRAYAVTSGGNSLKPIAPVRPRVMRNDAGDVTMRWDARTRNSDTWWTDGTRPVLSDPRLFDIELLSGTTVVNTRQVHDLGAGACSTIYTAAELTAIFGSVPASLSGRVYQVNNSTLGRGHPRSFNGL
jgi:hypothetical protein